MIKKRPIEIPKEEELRILEAARRADYDKRGTLKEVNVPGQLFYGETAIKNVLERYGHSFAKRGSEGGRISAKGLEEIREDYKKYEGDLAKAARLGRFSMTTYQFHWAQMGLQIKRQDSVGWGHQDSRARGKANEY